MKQNLKQLGVRESRLHCTCLKAEKNYTLLLQEMLVIYYFCVILYTVCQIFLSSLLETNEKQSEAGP